MSCEFNNTFIDKFYNDWTPDDKDFEIILRRIIKRIFEKKDFYRYKGKPLNKSAYFKLLKFRYS